MFSTLGAGRPNSVHSLCMHGPGLDSKQQEKFFEVVKKDDNKGLLKMIIKKGVDVNFLFRFNDYAEKMTALHYGAIHGQVQVVCTLLSCKQVNVDVKTPFDESTALHFSCGHSDDNSAFAMAETLLAHGAEVNALDHWEKTPLILAAQCGHLEVVRLLIRSGANLDHTYKIDDMPCVASMSLIDTVLQRDPSYGNNALTQACRFHYSDIVHELVREGADVNVVNRNKSSALHAAADLYFIYKNSLARHRIEINTGDPNIVSLLIEMGTDVNAMDSLGLSPLGRLLLALDEIRSVQLSRHAETYCCITALQIAQRLVRAGSCVRGKHPYRIGHKRGTVLNKLLFASEYILKYDASVVDEFQKLIRMVVTAGCEVCIEDVEIATSFNLQELTDFLLAYFDKPVPLKLLCVVAIRKHTRHEPLEKHLRMLHLPELLKKLVCLDIS